MLEHMLNTQFYQLLLFSRFYYFSLGSPSSFSPIIETSALKTVSLVLHLFVSVSSMRQYTSGKQRLQLFTFFYPPKPFHRTSQKSILNTYQMDCPIITYAFNIINKYLNEQGELPFMSSGQPYRGIIIILTLRIWAFTSSTSTDFKICQASDFSSKDRHLTSERLRTRPFPIPHPSKISCSLLLH